MVFNGTKGKGGLERIKVCGFALEKFFVVEGIKALKFRV